MQSPGLVILALKTDGWRLQGIRVRHAAANVPPLQHPLATSLSPAEQYNGSNPSPLTQVVEN